MKEVFEALNKMIGENTSAVLVTIIEMKGSTPGKAGFKMLVGEEGRVAGTIGGGGVEYYAIKKSKELIQSTQENLLETLVMKDTLSGSEPNNIEVKNDNGIKINALCGGEVTLFYEVIRPAKTIYIFGAGHVGRAVAMLARHLNYYVSVFDNRKEILDELTPDVFNEKKMTELQNLPEKDKSYLELDVSGFAIILTHNHKNDLQVLEYIYKNYPEMNYIGMIGSKRKVKEGIAYLKKRLGENIDFNNLYSPIGIDIGGDSPNEIALSILAQIQALANGKEIKHLRLNYNKI